MKTTFSNIYKKEYLNICKISYNNLFQIHIELIYVYFNYQILNKV